LLGLRFWRRRVCGFVWGVNLLRDGRAFSWGGLGRVGICLGAMCGCYVGSVLSGVRACVCVCVCARVRVRVQARAYKVPSGQGKCCPFWGTHAYPCVNTHTHAHTHTHARTQRHARTHAHTRAERHHLVCVRVCAQMRVLKKSPRGRGNAARFFIWRFNRLHCKHVHSLTGACVHSCVHMHGRTRVPTRARRDTRTHSLAISICLLSGVCVCARMRADARAKQVPSGQGKCCPFF
jgi:hypothetical protein